MAIASNPGIPSSPVYSLTVICCARVGGIIAGLYMPKPPVNAGSLAFACRRTPCISRTHLQIPLQLICSLCCLMLIVGVLSYSLVWCSPMTRVVKVLTAAAKNKWRQRARRRQLRQRTGYDGPVNLPVGNSLGA